jgi:hypothetical protein
MRVASAQTRRLVSPDSLFRASWTFSTTSNRRGSVRWWWCAVCRLVASGRVHVTCTCSHTYTHTKSRRYCRLSSGDSKNGIGRSWNEPNHLEQPAFMELAVGCWLALLSWLEMECVKQNRFMHDSSKQFTRIRKIRRDQRHSPQEEGEEPIQLKFK